MRLFAIIAVFVLLPLSAHAQTVDGIDRLITRFHDVTANWTGPLQLLTYGTFGTLAVIDLVYFVGVRTMMGRGDISDFIAALIPEVIFLSFFSWLMTTYSVTGPLIIKTFQWAAQQVGGVPMQPNGIFAEGLKIASAIVHQMSILHPGDSVAMLISGLLVLGCFALICGWMVIVIVESYFITTAGQIMMMFGGSHFTSDMAVGLLRTCVGVGLKLYAMQLVASVGAAFVADWVTQTANITFDNILLEIGEAAVLALVVAGIPHMFERLAGGVGTSGAGGVIAAGGTLMAAGTMMGRSIARAITGSAGGIAAIGSAGRLAGAQLTARNEAGAGPTSSAGRAGYLLGSTAANLAMAKAEDVGRGLRGTRSSLGQPIWRMASSMSEQRRLIQETDTRPQPPTTP